MAPTCPLCQKIIPPDDCNPGRDLAYCRSCREAFSLAELTLEVATGEVVDLARPPSGTWYRSGASGTVAGASHRSILKALFALIFGLFWNGIVSVFVVFALSGTLHVLHLPAPSWFPAPVMNDKTMAPGMVTFLWLFLTPFILVGLATVGAFLSSIAGRTEIRLRDGKGSVFVGLGPLGWSRNFVPGQVKSVKVEDRSWQDSDGDRHRRAVIALTLERKTITFGSGLSDQRRRFLAAALRQSLRKL